MATKFDDPRRITYQPPKGTKSKYALQNSLYQALLILYSTHIIRSDSMSLIYDPDARALAFRGVIEEKYLMIQNWILIPCNFSHLKIFLQG